MAATLEIDLDSIRQIIAGTEAAILVLAENPIIQQPEMDATLNMFRHKNKDVNLLLVMKGIRYVSLLNAYMVLFITGFSQEMCILARCMDETLEDTTFFLLPHGENGELSDRQRAAMEEFYQEEFADISAMMLKSNERHRVPRSRIRAAIATMKENQINPHYTIQIFSTTDDTYSGYVHGAYGHIMELYGGWPPHFHTRGMLGTPPYAYFNREVVTYTYRGLLIALSTAQKLQQNVIAQAVLAMRDSMERRFPHLAEDPRESVARLKRGKAKTS